MDEMRDTVLSVVFSFHGENPALTVAEVTGHKHRLDTLQSIELAEGVEIRLRIAGPIMRVFAWGIDLMVIVATLVVLGIALEIAGFVMGDNVTKGVMTLVGFAMSWWYPVFFEVSRWGATLGKRAFGLRVMQPSGAPITWSQAVVRNFLRVVDIYPPFWGLPGLVSCLATRRFQRLGDLAAGTVVVYDRHEPVPEISGPPPLKPQRPMVALRPEESRAIVTFRERAVYWSEARRREIADHLQVMTGKKGDEGVTVLSAIAHWLQDKR
jgi:uncharacterized RDD family membrane protein YckC